MTNVTETPEVTNTNTTSIDVKNLDFVKQSLNTLWDVFSVEVIKKLGDTPENRQWLLDKTTFLRHAHIATALNAVDFVEYYQHYVVGKREVDLPVIFTLENLGRGIRNHASAIPMTALNKHGVGTDDPRWVYDNLPVGRLFTGEPGSVRIPIRGETLTETIYGYLELFTFEKQIGDRIVKHITEIPAIRVKDNYIVPNAVWRWFEVEETAVKDAWRTGKSYVKK